MLHYTERTRPTTLLPPNGSQYDSQMWAACRRALYRCWKQKTFVWVFKTCVKYSLPSYGKYSTVDVEKTKNVLSVTNMYNTELWIHAVLREHVLFCANTQPPSPPRSFLVLLVILSAVMSKKKKKNQQPNTTISGWRGSLHGESGDTSHTESELNHVWVFDDFMWQVLSRPSYSTQSVSHVIIGLFFYWARQLCLQKAWLLHTLKNNDFAKAVQYWSVVSIGSTPTI